MKKSDLVWKFEHDVKKRKYVMRVLLALDQLLNVLLWNGSQDETVSSHVGRRIADGKAYKVEVCLCKFLTWLQSKHCSRAKGE